MTHSASASILSLFSPFPAPPLRGLRGLCGLPGLNGNIQLVQDGSRILMGSITAPYLPEEGRRDLVPLREMLRARRQGERQDGAEGLTIAITPRSPLLLHDLDLLIELDREHAVSVDVLLPDLDADVVRRLE